MTNFFIPKTGTANPFSFFIPASSTPSLADLDGDGDLDAIVGEKDGTLKYYKNTGSRTNPIYATQTGTANPFNGIDVGFFSTPSFADLDGDGDLDAIIGESDGNLNYYKNTGSRTNPLYAVQIGTANPFNGIDVGTQSAPSFADLDGDGDLDAIVGEDLGNLNYFQSVVPTPRVTNVLVTATAIKFTAFDENSPTLSLASPFAAAFGNPTINNGTPTSLSPTQQTTAVSGMLQVTDGTATANVIGLFLGTINNDSFTATASPSALYGFGGNDTLTGGTGNNILSGDVGNDKLRRI